MNTRQFFEAMNEVSDKYYEEAASYHSKKHKRIKWSAMAACLCIVAAGAFAIPQFIGNDAPTVPPAMKEQAYGFTMEESDVLYLPISFSQRKKFGLVDKNAAGLTKENEYKATDNDLGDVMGIVCSSQDKSLVGKTVYHFVRFPANDSICIVEAGGEYEFYVKQDIEETEETVSYDITIDAPADEDSYHETGDNILAGDKAVTLEYITGLQAKVSKAMSDGDLPFVYSSAIYENPYRLHIIVSSNTKKDLASLKKFDTTGKALEIVYEANPASAEKAAKE